MRNPYITGPYVLGRRHYGRSDLLDRLLHGESHAYWIIGNRRIGKTSLLRQLETLVLTDERLLLVFWDMQGCNSIERLGCYLADAIQERLDELLTLGLSVVAVSTRTIYQMREVCRSWPTSPFLAGFDLSQMLGSLDAAIALALVVQAQADEQVQVEPDVSAAVCDLSNCHPFLLQLLCAPLRSQSR